MTNIIFYNKKLLTLIWQFVLQNELPKKLIELKTVSKIFSCHLPFPNNFKKYIYINPTVYNSIHDKLPIVSDYYVIHGLFCSFDKLNKLENIKYLAYADFSFCHWIKNVDFLKNNKKVNLDGNLYIKDLTPLKNFTYVSLCGCYEITDVSPLKNCEYVDLSYAKNVRDFSSLTNVKSLNLTGCWYLESVKGLENVKELNLSQIPNLVDVSPLDFKKNKIITYNSPNFYIIDESGRVKYLSKNL